MVAASIEAASAALVKLYPSDSGTIQNNAAELISKIHTAKADFEKVVREQDLKLYGLTDEFFYLTNDIEIPVVDYVIKPENEWTIDDFGELIKNLYDLGQPMVIASTQPMQDISLATNTAGSRLAVLDTYAASEEDIVTIATGNMEKITAALTGPARRRGGAGGDGGDGGMGGGMGGMGG